MARRDLPAAWAGTATSRRSDPAQRSGEYPVGLVRQFLLPQKYARHIRMHRVDFTHCPAVESPGSDQMDEA